MEKRVQIIIGVTAAVILLIVSTVIIVGKSDSEPKAVTNTTAADDVKIDLKNPAELSTAAGSVNKKVANEVQSKSASVSTTENLTIHTNVNKNENKNADMDGVQSKGQDPVAGNNQQNGGNTSNVTTEANNENSSNNSNNTTQNHDDDEEPYETTEVQTTTKSVRYAFEGTKFSVTEPLNVSCGENRNCGSFDIQVDGELQPYRVFYSEAQVPKSKTPLGTVLSWFFGASPKNIAPIIEKMKTEADKDFNIDYFFNSLQPVHSKDFYMSNFIKKPKGDDEIDLDDEDLIYIRDFITAYGFKEFITPSAHVHNFKVNTSNLEFYIFKDENPQYVYESKFDYENNASFETPIVDLLRKVAVSKYWLNFRTDYTLGAFLVKNFMKKKGLIAIYINFSTQKKQITPNFSSESYFNGWKSDTYKGAKVFVSGGRETCKTIREIIKKGMKAEADLQSSPELKLVVYGTAEEVQEIENGVIKT